MNDPLLVFGAGGQVGQEFLALAKTRGVAAIGLTHIEANITDEHAVTMAFAHFHPKIVVNAAAYTAVNRAEHERDAAFAANAEGPAILGRAALQAGAFIVHLSTDYVFDGAKSGAYTECDPPAPINVYGESKAEGEWKLKQTGATHIVLRTSWVYSSYGNNFLKTIIRLAHERDELRVVADQFGCPTCALDVSEAILAVIRKIKVNPGSIPDTFHFAAREKTSWHGFAAEIVRADARFTGRNPTVTAIAAADYPTLARRPRNSTLDSSLFERTFSYCSQPWRDAVSEVVGQLYQLEQQEPVT